MAQGEMDQRNKVQITLFLAHHEIGSGALKDIRNKIGLRHDDAL
jgi:hypothetical protein